MISYSCFVIVKMFSIYGLLVALVAMSIIYLATILTRNKMVIWAVLIGTILIYSHQFEEVVR